MGKWTHIRWTAKSQGSYVKGKLYPIVKCEKYDDQNYTEYTHNITINIEGVGISSWYVPYPIYFQLVDNSVPLSPLEQEIEDLSYIGYRNG